MELSHLSHMDGWVIEDIPVKDCWLRLENIKFLEDFTREDSYDIIVMMRILTFL